MNLSAFMAKNALPAENVKFVLSPRFLSDEPELDEQGRPIVLSKTEEGEPIYKMKPMAWEIKPISGAEDEALRKACKKQVPVPGRKGQYQRETDYDLYTGKLAVACTVWPNLNDAALQDSYKVLGAEALLKAMLTNGEYANYVEKVQEVCGFTTTFQEEVDEAKN